MKSSAMFVDYWEEFNQKRVEFRRMMQELLAEAWSEGYGVRHNEGGSTSKTGAKYAEEKIRDLF